MRKNFGMRSRQRGAVAVILGITAIVLFAFMGIGVDLAYTYSRKTELQNAADAAALSGAKKLNLTAAGVTLAIADAIATFNQNHTNNFVGSTFVITVANLRLGSCPNPDDVLPLRIPNCTFVAASSVTTDAAAGNKSFLEVKTPTQTRNTFFMLVAGSPTTSTLGYAVAGRFVTDVTPIGICGIDPGPPATKKYTGTNELVELGYRRGVAYDLFALNPLGPNPSDPWLVNPVDVPPAACQPSHSSANFTLPFVCQGTSGVVSGATAGVSVYGNTGLSNSVLQAVNSRFDMYSAPYGSNKCDVTTAPPDWNIKQYCWNPLNAECHTPPTAVSGTTWMAGGQPTQQSVSINASPKTPQYALPPAANPNLQFNKYGTLWSYGPAYNADAAAPPGAGTAFTPATANSTLMYNTAAGTTFFKNSYPTTVDPGFPPGTQPSPYNHQASGQWFQAPGNPGTRNRRVLNLLIINCAAVSGSGGCGKNLPVLGVGKFFMQKMADPTGSKKLEVEFAGLVEPVPTSEIKLYR